MSDYIVYKSRLKQIAIVLGGGLMVAASIVVLVVGWRRGRADYLFGGAIGLLFFGFAEIFAIQMIFIGNKLLVVTNEGFYDFSSAIATKKLLIPWESIKEIKQTEVRMKGTAKPFITVFLKNPETFLAQLPAVKRAAIALNIKMGTGEINITLQSAKHRDFDGALKKMQEHLRVFGENQ